MSKPSSRMQLRKAEFAIPNSPSKAKLGLPISLLPLASALARVQEERDYMSGLQMRAAR